jgi:putative isomerase
MSVHRNNLLSRRDLLASMAAAAGSSLVAGSEPCGAQSMAAASSFASTERKQAADKLTAFFAANGEQLLRPAQGVLQHPSVSPSLPGKEYSTSLWDWDTLWTSRSLFRLANVTGNTDLHRKVALHVQGSLFNFFDHQSEEGRMPIMISTSNPDPFGCLTKASPNYRNQAKPVMAQLALLVADETQDVAWLAPRFDQLLRFHDSWVLGNQTATGLLVWGDDVAIGNDNDPTTFGRPFFSSANPFLNCLFYADLQAAAELAKRLDRPRDHERLSAQAAGLSTSIQKQCWDQRDRFYYTADVQCKDRRSELIPGVNQGMAMSWETVPLRIQVFTGFMPLWCGIASREQATQLIQANYLKDDRFRAEHGVRSLSNLESMYSLAFSSNPSNWLGPVWIIANYFVWKGLRNYGFTEEADELAGKTIRLLAADLEKNGNLNEYYHPDTGAALSHHGFMDWNLLVLEMI